MIERTWFNGDIRWKIGLGNK